MDFKTITIVFVPDGAGRTKQFKVPKLLFVGVATLSFFVLTFFGGLAWDYHAIKSNMPGLDNLKRESNEQKRHLTGLVSRIDQISSRLMALKEFDQRLRIMLELDPGADQDSFLGIGGSDPTMTDSDYSMERAHQKLVRLMYQSLSNLDSEVTIRANEKAELYKFFENQKSLLAHTPSIYPARGWLSSRFGYRISPFTNKREFHEGLDISAKIKTPIIAPADGVVSSMGWDYGYGRVLHLRHGYGMKTVYAHLSKTLVKKGQYVKRGQKIALMGNSGRSTGPHLHYEVHVNGIPVNPLRYILD